MAIEDVGARLIITGGPEYVAEVDSAAASTEALTAALTEAAAAADALAAAQERAAAAAAATAEATAGAAAASTDAAVAAGAGATAVAGETAAKADATAVADAGAGAIAGETVAKQDLAKATATHTAAVAANTTSLAQNNVVKKAALLGTGAIALGTYEAIKSYSNFNKLVTQSAVDAGVPVGNLKQVQADLVQMSNQYGISLNDAANTWYRIASSASGTSTTMAQMKQYATDTAKLDVLFNVPAGSQTEQTARIMGAMMNAHLPGAQTPDQIMALINSAVGHGDIRGADMIGSLGKVLSAAKFTGAQAPDIMAWIDTLTKLGMQGSQAGTLINHSVQQLTTGSSEQAQKALLSIGIQPGQMDQVVTQQGLPAAIQLLVSQIQKGGQTAGANYPSTFNLPAGQVSASAQQDAWLLGDPKAMADWRAGTATPAELHTIEAGFLSKMFGAAKSASPLLALASDPTALQNLVASIKAGATPQALQASMNLAMNTPARRQQIADQNVKNLGVQAGKDLTGAGTAAMTALGGLAKDLANNSGALIALMSAIGVLVGSAITVVAVDKIKKLATGIAGIGKALYNLPSNIASTASNIGSSVSNLAYRATGGAIGTQAVANVIPATSEEIFSTAVGVFSAAVDRFAAKGIIPTTGEPIPGEPVPTGNKPPATAPNPAGDRTPTTPPESDSNPLGSTVADTTTGISVRSVMSGLLTKASLVLAAGQLLSGDNVPYPVTTQARSDLPSYLPPGFNVNNPGAKNQDTQANIAYIENQLIQGLKDPSRGAGSSATPEGTALNQDLVGVLNKMGVNNQMLSDYIKNGPLAKQNAQDAAAAAQAAANAAQGKVGSPGGPFAAMQNPWAGLTQANPGAVAGLSLIPALLEHAQQPPTGNANQSQANINTNAANNANQAIAKMASQAQSDFKAAGADTIAANKTTGTASQQLQTAAQAQQAAGLAIQTQVAALGGAAAALSAAAGHLSNIQAPAPSANPRGLSGT